ncbi:MAG: hypothetical protein KF861_12220 [Planctomycetaceae bacterium]|nr:hypothetical protein [Planctomycetaceae bacterium]
MIWGGRIPLSALTDLESLIPLYATAVAQGAFTHDVVALEEFLSWAHYCATASGIKNPPGVFTTQLIKPDRFRKCWRDKIRIEDREWAARELQHGLNGRGAKQLKIAVEQAARRSVPVRERILSACPSPIGKVIE